MKKVFGYLIITYLVLNVIATAVILFVAGINLMALPSLLQALYISIFLLDGAIHWTQGKAWGNSQKELQKELAKTRKWE